MTDNDKQITTRKTFNWPRIRAAWESGKSAHALSQSRYNPTAAAISRRAKSEGWERSDIESDIQSRVSTLVSGAEKADTIAEREKALEKEALRRSAVELRHREEPHAVRNLAKSAIQLIIDTTNDLIDTTDSDKRAEIRERRRLAMENLKSAKLAAEVLEKVQNMERKSNRLDTEKPTTNVVTGITLTIVDTNGQQFVD